MDCEALRRYGLLMKALYYCSSPKHIDDRCYQCPFGNCGFRGGKLCEATVALVDFMEGEEE